MTIKYRGFNIKATRSDEVCYITENHQIGNCEGYICGVFSIEPEISDKELMGISLAINRDIPDMSKISLIRGVYSQIDDAYGYLMQQVNNLNCERKNCIVNKLTEIISLNQSPEVLYEILHDTIQMSDKEIQEAGILSLVPFFNRDEYAQTIADFMVQDGTENTGTTDYGYTYEELQEMFGIDLCVDTDMKDLIFEKLSSSYSDNISSIKMYSNGMEINFKIWCCPYIKEDAGFDGLDEGFNMTM